MDRRLFTAGLTSFAAAGLPSLASPRIASAQSLQAGRPIKLVVPFPAGGSTDVIGRIMAEGLATRLATPVVIENKPGAGGTIGAAQVAKAAPDGHELLIASVAISTNHHIFRNLSFDPVKDLAPVSFVATVPNALLVGPHMAARSTADLIAAAKAAPGKITYGSAGIGTSAHLAAELFCQATGVTMTHVPYRGTGPALNDLVGGRLDVMFDILTAAIAQVKAGTVRALGVTTLQPNPLLPGVPPVAETVAGFEVTTWNGVFAPAATPPATIERISSAIAAVMAEPEVKNRLSELSVEARGTPPADLAALLAAESEKWGRLVRVANIRSGD
ncbi:Bug family tripartite tricarboxylate transporter substrate binding protein [Phreatobacter oligotrophus]|uniref:Tripartite-type tricarboxylate transporter receptor subunit TctC n=1 Tax=Phreatobacter oligotrophus TaxID=1122261 RepID=A0A2T4Z5S0_9HYPH|nr:tripartite tricarboxylate transporter substrate binding protein [Phreatobacter oligotrophus]PTM57231.1 tripartite-type tricarboxylate transporter receptor subunit TctC [Phreatobacter oligotrophus]